LHLSNIPLKVVNGHVRPNPESQDQHVVADSTDDCWGQGYPWDNCWEEITVTKNIIPDYIEPDGDRYGWKFYVEGIMEPGVADLTLKTTFYEGSSDDQDTVAFTVVKIDDASCSTAHIIRAIRVIRG
jgi:hypothetical protein